MLAMPILILIIKVEQPIVIFFTALRLQIS